MIPTSSISRALEWASRRFKALVAFAGVVAGEAAAEGLLGDTIDWRRVGVVAVLVALGVHQAPNRPAGP